jgi:5'-nucleotidase
MATHARLTLFSLFVLLVVCFAWPAHGQADAYHILLTNDDGIESAGIQVLAEELAAVGQVHVVAPCGQRSGSSMSVALRDEYQLRSVQQEGQPLQHCVDTTPAGAVMLAITTLSPEGGFDLVVSGINSGANVGAVAHMSGTVGAAMMGAFYGLPAVAASLGGRGENYDYPAQFVAAFVKELKQRPALPGIVLSINIPKATEEETTGVAVAKMGESYLDIAFQELEGEQDERRFRPKITLETNISKETDTAAYMDAMITVTPLQFDWTAYSAMDQLKEWTLSHEVAGRTETQ